MNQVAVAEEQARQEILAAAARHEEDLERAIVDLKHAVKRPFAIGDRLAQHALPVLLGALLIGLWLGSRHHHQGD